MSYRRIDFEGGRIWLRAVETVARWARYHKRTAGNGQKMDDLADDAASLLERHLGRREFLRKDQAWQRNADIIELLRPHIDYLPWRLLLPFLRAAASNPTVLLLRHGKRPVATVEGARRVAKFLDWGHEAGELPRLLLTRHEMPSATDGIDKLRDRCRLEGVGRSPSGRSLTRITGPMQPLPYGLLRVLWEQRRALGADAPESVLRMAAVDKKTLADRMSKVKAQVMKDGSTIRQVNTELRKALGGKNLYHEFVGGTVRQGLYLRLAVTDIEFNDAVVPVGPTPFFSV